MLPGAARKFRFRFKRAYCFKLAGLRILDKFMPAPSSKKKTRFQWCKMSRGNLDSQMEAWGLEMFGGPVRRKPQVCVQQLLLQCMRTGISFACHEGATRPSVPLIDQMGLDQKQSLQVTVQGT